MLTPQERIAFFNEIHKGIEHIAAKTARELRAGIIELAYPPNAGLSESEQTEITSFPINDDLESALRKIVANAASAPLFDLFCLLDGVADPEAYEGEWVGFELMKPSDDEEQAEMLHDAFFETYWGWRDRRPDRGWKLDVYEG